MGRNGWLWYVSRVLGTGLACGLDMCETREESREIPLCGVSIFSLSFLRHHDHFVCEGSKTEKSWVTEVVSLLDHHVHAFSEDNLKLRSKHVFFNGFLMHDLTLGLGKRMGCWGVLILSRYSSISPKTVWRQNFFFLEGHLSFFS